MTTISRRSTVLIAAITGLAAGVAGTVLGGLLPMRDKSLHDYLVSHPEVLTEMVDALKAKDSAKQLAQVGPKALQEWPGAVLGNPAGKTVLVEFMDFACGYCKASEAEVAKVLAANPDVKLVIRQLPILSPESADAAKMGLAAARQGKYAAFHKAMFATGHPNAESIAAAAKAAGVDLAAAQKVIADPAAQAEIESNLAMARTLGINGTPSWIAQGRVLGGALDAASLQSAIAG